MIRSFFTFICNRSSKMNYFIFTSNHLTPHGRYHFNKLTLLPTAMIILHFSLQRQFKYELYFIYTSQKLGVIGSEKFIWDPMLFKYGFQCLTCCCSIFALAGTCCNGQITAIRLSSTKRICHVQVCQGFCGILWALLSSFFDYASTERRC